MTYPVYKPNHHSYVTVEQASHITNGALLTSDRQAFSQEMTTYAMRGQFQTVASRIGGGITTVEEVEPAAAGPHRAGWGWGDDGWGIAPPTSAPIGDAILPLLLCALLFVLRRRIGKKEIQLK